MHQTYKISTSLSVTNKEGCICPGVEGNLTAKCCKPGSASLWLPLEARTSCWGPFVLQGHRPCWRWPAMSHCWESNTVYHILSWLKGFLGIYVPQRHMDFRRVYIDRLETGHQTWSMDPTWVPIYISLQLPSQP